jgi:hypothetical protein
MGFRFEFDYANRIRFGLARMFQIVGEGAQPMLRVVRTVNDALAALGVHSSHFEPLE